MGYDNDGELTNIVEETTTKFPICFYTLNYNQAGRVQWEFKGPLPHPYTPPGRTKTFDADNRLFTFNGTSVTVDNNGRLTYGPGTNNTFGTYSYDARNELTVAGGIYYGYDPAGNRTSITNGSTNTTFVMNPQGSQVLMRISGGLTNYYIYGGGLLYEIDTTSSATTTVFYHFDCRGSTIALTDSNGNPTDLIEYSPFGTTTHRAGTNDTPFLYNGQFGVQTDANGLLYMRARYYNPYICRFLNRDPSGFNAGLNFYQFVSGNPVSNWDPTGLCAEGSSATPANLQDPFGLNANNPSYATLVGNGLNNTVSAIGQSMGQGLYDLTHLAWSQDQYNKIYAQMYSTGTPENPAATPYVEGALAVSSAAAVTAGAAGTWELAGGATTSIGWAPTVQGPGIHFFWGVTSDGSTVVLHTLGDSTTIGGANWAGYLGGNTAVTGIPAFFPGAASATGVSSFNCFTGAIGGVLRGIFGFGFGL